MDKNKVLAGMEAKKKERAMNHQKLIRIHGQAKGLTQKEWENMQVKVKGSGSKGKGFANNRLWDHHNEPLQIKYDW